MIRSLETLVQDVIPVASSNWKLSLLQNWETIAGTLKDQMRLEKIQGEDTLIVGISNTAWMQELYCLSDMLLHKINSTLEYPHIKRLRFKYSPAHKKTKTTPTKPHQVFQPIALSTKEQRALNSIPDPQLRESLEHFLQRCRQEESHEKTIPKPYVDTKPHSNGTK